MSIIVNLILGSVKLILALISGSASLLADAIHTYTDIATSFIIILSFIFSRKPSDRRHPFGHGRIEQISSLVMAVLIGVSGLELIRIGFSRFFDPQPVNIGSIGISIIVITIVFKEILGQISNYYGKKIQSMALEADAWHHRTDAISSILVIIALIAAKNGIPVADGLMGIIIGVYIIWLSVDLAKKSSLQLMGTGPSSELLASVKQITDKDEKVLAIHEMVCHEYGPLKVISFHLEVPSHLTLSEAHTIAENIEDRIMKELHIQATVHLDPVLPFNKHKDTIRDILDDFFANKREFIRYDGIKLIGEESQATLVMNITLNKTLADDVLKMINESLSTQILKKIPEIRDIRINYLVDSIQTPRKHLS